MDKVQWEEVLKVNRRTLFKVFSAGAAVGFIVGLIIGYIGSVTGFRL
jgi:hypothetical protein